jgi:hypothetical protein
MLNRTLKNAAGLLLLAMILTVPAGAQANPDAWVREAETELRTAQSLFFNGKREEALGKLVAAHRLAGNVRQAAPADPRLGGLDSRIARLKGDLERRMGGTVDLEQGGLVPAAPAAGAPPAMPAAAAPPTRLPHYADLALGGALRTLSSVNGPYTRFDYYREQRDFNAILKALDSIDETLAEVPAQIEEARRLAAEKGITGFPGFEEALGRLAEEKARSAKTRQETLQQASASAGAGEAVIRDVDALAAIHDRLQTLLLKQTLGHSLGFTDPQEAGAFLDRIERFEREETAPAREHLAGFAATYGDTRDAIDRQIRAQGYPGNRLAGTLYEDLAKGLDNVAKTRTATAADLLRHAREERDGLLKAHDFFRAERRARVQALADMAARYDGRSAEIQDFLRELPAKLEADLQAWNARIDARTWPASSAGKRVEQEAGLRFFREDADWGARPRDKEPRIPAAVAITGDWTVQKKDLFGQPVMHGLAALVAVEVPAEKAGLNVLRVYQVTLRTAEGAPSKPVPPFREITVGDSYFIRPRAVK